MKKKTEGGLSRKEKLCEVLDIPPDLATGGCMIEIRGRSEAVIGGLRRIKVFNENQLLLEMKDFDISIVGEGLICPAFGDKKLMIGGIISGISFEKREG